MTDKSFASSSNPFTIRIAGAPRWGAMTARKEESNFLLFFKVLMDS